MASFSVGRGVPRRRDALTPTWSRVTWRRSMNPASGDDDYRRSCPRCPPGAACPQFSGPPDPARTVDRQLPAPEERSVQCARSGDRRVGCTACYGDARRGPGNPDPFSSDTDPDGSGDQPLGRKQMPIRPCWSWCRTRPCCPGCPRRSTVRPACGACRQPPARGPGSARSGRCRWRGSAPRARTGPSRRRPARRSRCC